MRTPSRATGFSAYAHYILGFALSLLLTAVAYLVVLYRFAAGFPLAPIILSAAVAQALVQLLLFLELGRETKPRWKLYTFFYMICVLLILFLGTLWIMSNISYNLT